MTIQAQFSDIKWDVSEARLMPIGEMQYSFGIKTEIKSSSGGYDKVICKGYKADSISVSYTASKMCGVDPEEELKLAESLLGVKSAFILGGKRLGPLKTMLMSVKSSNVVYNNTGIMISLDITLTFGEPDEEKSKKKGKKGKKSTLLDKMKQEKGIKK